MRSFWVLGESRPLLLCRKEDEGEEGGKEVRFAREGRATETRRSQRRTKQEGRTVNATENFDDLGHLILLERKVLLVVDLGFFSFEDRSKSE